MAPPVAVSPLIKVHVLQLREAAVSLIYLKKDIFLSLSYFDNSTC